MKHKLSITILLLSLFLITQLIGIAVLNAYSPTITEIYDETTNQTNVNIEKQKLPFGLEYEENKGSTPNFLSIILALILAFVIFGFLMKYNLKYIIKIWFMLVILISLGITFYPLLTKYFSYASFYALALALPLIYYKIIKPNIYIHNLTEILIYPGISVVIVSLIYSPSNRIASSWFIVLLLILISLYDAWAVWKSKIMQKMAKYQMEELQIFGGFLFPTMTKKEKEKYKKLKEKYKNKKVPTKVQNKKFKINLAILGGGDVIFPIISAGTFMWLYPEQILFGIPGLIPALFILGGATLGLTYLFLNTKKDKAYPAMPYISIGIFIGLALWWLFF